MLYMFVCVCGNVSRGKLSWERVSCKGHLSPILTRRDYWISTAATATTTAAVSGLYLYNIYVCNVCVCVGICVNRRGMVKNPIVIAVLCDVYTYYYIDALYATARVGFLSAATNSIKRVHCKARRKQNNGTKKWIKLKQ